MPDFGPLDSITQIAGIAGKHPVRVATTADITLTGTPPASIDGVVLAEHDRVLVWQQIDATQNGIYRVSPGGDLVRAYDLFVSAELFAGLNVYVAEGTTYTKKTFHLTTTGVLSLGVSEVTFEILAPPTQLFGNGLVDIGGGVIGLDNYTTPLTAHVYLDGATNAKNIGWETVRMELYTPDPSWMSYGEIFANSSNDGLGNFHPYYGISVYHTNSFGSSYDYASQIQLRRDISQLSVGEINFHLDNSFDGPSITAELTIRNNSAGRYLDLGYDLGSGNYTRNMALRLGRFAGDTADGLLDSDAVIYYDSATSKLRGKEGGVWKDLVQEEATSIPEVLVTNSFNEEAGLNLALKTSAYLVLPVPKFSVNKVDFFIPMQNSLNGDTIVETVFVITGAAAAADYKPRLVCELRYEESNIVLKRFIDNYTDLTTQYAWDDHPDWAALIADLGGANSEKYFELRIHGTIALEDFVNGGNIAFAFYTAEGYAGTYLKIKSGAYASLIYIDEEGTPP